MTRSDRAFGCNLATFACFFTTRRIRVGLVLTTLIGFLFRLARIGFGYPYWYYWDESYNFRPTLGYLTDLITHG